MRRKRIEACNTGSVIGKNKYSGEFALLILPRSPFKPLVKIWNTAAKSGTVVARIKRFNSEFSRKSPARHYLTRFFL